jgi:hypothetical protein
MVHTKNPFHSLFLLFKVGNRSCQESVHALYLLAMAGPAARRALAVANEWKFFCKRDC